MLVAAAFWTWLWGPVGLLLSTPLTVCLVVMGKYVPSLEFLSIILSDEPALSPPDRVYQRLLADDHEEAADLIHEYAKTMPLEELYDTVLLPALALAEGDAHHGGLTPERRAAVHRGVADIVDEMGDRLKADAAKEAANGRRQGRRRKASARPHLPAGCLLNVVCLPAHDESDELAAAMLGQLLEPRGTASRSSRRRSWPARWSARSTPPTPTWSSSRPCPRRPSPTPATCASGSQAKPPAVETIVGLWARPATWQRARDRIACGRAVQLAGGLRQAIGQLHEIVQPKLINAALARPVTGTG